MKPPLLAATRTLNGRGAWVAGPRTATFTYAFGCLVPVPRGGAASALASGASNIAEGYTGPGGNAASIVCQYWREYLNRVGATNASAPTGRGR